MKRYLPLLFIVVVWFIFAYPFFFKGKVPYPSTYQVNNYAPWSAYEQFWGPVKNGAMPDIVTQIYPWRYFTIESLKKGQVVFWNPYSFSGTPHLANYQSAVFSPLNVLFFLPIQFVDAWSIMILLQPLLAGIFMYLFMRTVAQSAVASLISSLPFMFSGFITTWMGYGTLSLAIGFLPLALFSIEKFYHTQQLRYVWILGISIPLSFFSGHFQTSVYFLIFLLAYLAFKLVSTKNMSSTFHLLLSTFFGFLLSMPQILPSIEFYMQSVRSEMFIKGEVIPLSYIPTLLAPDFFGNPVTRNDWFGHYAEWNAFAGVLPFLLSIYCILRKREKATVFFIVVAVVSFFLAFDTKLLDVLFSLKIPVLATSAASRIIVLFSFCIAVLSGFGFDQLVQDSHKKKIRGIFTWLTICSILFIILWAVVLFKLYLPFDKVGISKSNLVLPTLLFFSALLSIILLTRTSKRKFIILNSLFMLFLVSFDMLRFATKWMPFDPKDRAFPNISVTKFMSQISGYDRSIGNYEAGVATYYQLPSLEGYDPLYIARYGEFVSSLTDGKIKSSLYRSVVSFSRNGLYSRSAVDFLGVKYIIHKKGDDGLGWTFPYWEYPKEQFKLIFEDPKYRIFENKKAFPRAFLAEQYRVLSENQYIIDTMFGKDFNLQKEVILEEHPGISWKDLNSDNASTQAVARITRYQQNLVEIETNSDSNAILVLTDSYYPGWKGFLDGKETKIYRADYAFRSVVVPKGAHRVEFKYEPASFRLGLYAAIAGVVGMLVLMLLLINKSKIKYQRSKTSSKF